MRLVLRIGEKLLQVIFSLNKSLVFIPFMLLTFSCSTPLYKEVKNEDVGSEQSLIYDTITYYVADEFNTEPPTCLFIPPFSYDQYTSISKEALGEINLSPDELVRRSVYAHTSLLPYKDIELVRVDFIINKKNINGQLNYSEISHSLSCDTFLLGHVKEFNKQYVGVYSEISVGANLKLIRSMDKTVLWESEYVVKNRGGSIPLSPIGIAFGIFDASENISDENILSLVDDLARRMISTIPVIKASLPSQQENRLFSKGTLEGVNYKNSDIVTKSDSKMSHKLFKKMIIEENISLEDANKLYSTLTERHGLNVESGISYSKFLLDNGSYEHSLSNIVNLEKEFGISSDTRSYAGRIHLKMANWEKAREAFTKAVSLDPDNILHYKALGSTFIKLNNFSKAKAAFKMVLKRDVNDGFALYNSGIIHFLEGNYDVASGLLANAGISYAEKSDTRSVALVISSLDKLETLDYPLSKEVKKTNKLLKKFINREKM